MSEPEPLTPEERYDQFYQRVDDGDVRLALSALRDMIEADRYEMNLLLAALTTLDNRVSALEAKARS